MGVCIAPRLDPRLRQYIAGAPFFASPAQVTREVGDLAWQLGLPRPSYQQVRELMGGANRPTAPRESVQTSKGRVVLRAAGAAFDFLYQYPGPGLEDWYRRYKRGLV
ncbi:MAG TPA: hypothetical protein VI408_02875 [Gaiellaceae bacterium]